MTWRERIEAAKVRGEFSEQDRRDILECETCFYGDVMASVGIAEDTREWYVWADDPIIDPLIFNQAIRAVDYDDFALAETTLERIEDRVLQLKRRASPGAPTPSV